MAYQLRVFREFNAKYEQVGTLFGEQGEAKFSYTDKYLASVHAKGIATIFPPQEKPFSEKTTRSFFEGLLPEGSIRRLFVDTLRLGAIDAYPELLAVLNNESSGALVLGSSMEDITDNRAYVPFSADEFERFAASPYRVALELEMSSRLSLAGAQNKIGLYFDGAISTSKLENTTYSHWYLPIGSAPSTHIIKATDEAFPLQTINEAYCLKVARHCGFDVADCALLQGGLESPLLAVKRFDRDIRQKEHKLGKLVLPRRLHQEDFCQAEGFLPWLKYEPTDGHYLELAAGLIDRVSANPFGDRMMFFSRVLFDLLIGNCDNHLKNHSFLWSADWTSCALSPLYDVTCTTMYANLAREMGVALCESRRIDDVTRKDIIAAAKRVGISEKMALQTYAELVEQFPDALTAAEQELVDQGFDNASKIAAFIDKDSMKRRSL